MEYKIINFAEALETFLVHTVFTYFPCLFSTKCAEYSVFNAIFNMNEANYLFNDTHLIFWIVMCVIIYENVPAIYSKKLKLRFSLLFHSLQATRSTKTIK